MSDPIHGGKPGLRKARRVPLVAQRRASLARGSEPRWRELFEAADTVSEGSVRSEAEGEVWYGSTSLILRLEHATPETCAFFAAVAARDLHVRLRALRAARREATLRAPQPLGPSSCEIRVGPDPRGVRIDVDVQAPLIGGGAGTATRIPATR